MDAQFIKHQKRLSAFHEAGHAVIAFLEGDSVRDVNIEFIGDRSGLATISVRGDEATRAVKHFRISIAGQIAEDLVERKNLDHGTTKYGQGDQACIAQALANSPRSDAEWQKEQWLAVRDRLKAHWPMVESLAAGLLRQESICEQHVDDILEQHPGGVFIRRETSRDCQDLMSLLDALPEDDLPEDGTADAMIQFPDCETPF